MNRISMVVALAAGSMVACAANLGTGSGRGAGGQSEATPELEQGLALLEGAVEQNRRNRIAIFEGNALASRVFENAMNAELRVIGLDVITYVDHPMTLVDAPSAELIGMEGLGDAVDPTTPVGVPDTAACAFALPTPAIDTTSLSCRFLVSNAQDRARVRSSQALVETPLYDEFADEAPDPAEVRDWYVRALQFGIETSISHALDALRGAGACDREPTVSESAFERGVVVGRRAVLEAVRAQESRTPRTQCDVDQIVFAATRALAPSELADSDPLCPGFTAASADEATYLAGSNRELTAGIEAGMAEGELQEQARLVREWVCEIPMDGGGGDGGGGGDPLVLDLNGDGVHIVPLSMGAFFDFGHTGRVHTEWLSGDDGFLVLDRDHDGEIVSTELFGDVTVTEDGSRAADGLEALALYDEESRGGNADGRIDARDAVFASLAIWNDRDGDARTDDGELESLEEAGVTAIEYRYGRFLTADGEGLAVDVWFTYRNL